MDAINTNAIPYDEYQRDYQAALDTVYRAPKLPSPQDIEVIVSERESFNKVMENLGDIVAKESDALRAIVLKQLKRSGIHSTAMYRDIVFRFRDHIAAIGYGNVSDRYIYDLAQGLSSIFSISENEPISRLLIQRLGGLFEEVMVSSEIHDELEEI